MTEADYVPGVKITATGLDPDKNGLLPTARDMIDNPGRVRVAVIVYDTTGVDIDFAKQTKIAKAKVRRVEVITDGEDLRQAQRLILRASDRRSGREVLPYDMQTEIEDAFADFVDDGTLPDGDED